MNPSSSDTESRPRIRTTIGRPPGPAPYVPPLVRRAVIRRRLERGPFLAGFDAGLYDLRDAAPRNIERVRLTRLTL